MYQSKFSRCAGKRSIFAGSISEIAVPSFAGVIQPAPLALEPPRGTRRIYRLHDEGLAAVHAYLERVWGEAGARFRLLAENTEP